ncbi:2-hydroxyacid dehydrogenase [Bacillus sp. Gen3]|uniref:NAD(P)-dependent oxidoreductase n=1 Tax=Heyndrickxia sp. FSL W8-0496 TaxID=2954702 RepID=UPI0015D41531|nr:2-hydroxyacid dehydrogenase [Bacillus sp. Gen3]
MAKVIVVGDPLVSSNLLEKAALQLKITGPIEVKKFEWYSDISKKEFQRIIKKIEMVGPEYMDIPNGILEELETANYLLVHYAPVSRKMIEHAQHLKVIGTCRGGTEHVNMTVCQEHGIPVIHVIRNAEAVADFTIGLMYAETRNISRAHQFMMNGQWKKAFPNDPYKTTLSHLKVGICGFGHIGKLVIKRLNALGVDVLLYSSRENKDDLNKNGLSVEMVDLETLFTESDIVSLHARVTKENRNMIDKSLISRMKPSSYLINTARPELLDKEDLIDALRNHRIAGAAIDVFWEEPLDPNDELLKLDNITLTPHIAGDTVDAILGSPNLLRDALNEYFRGGQTPTALKW